MKILMNIKLFNEDTDKKKLLTMIEIKFGCSRCKIISNDHADEH